MRETVKDMLCGETETLKIESLKEAVTKLHDIIQQAKVGKTLQGTLNAMTADMWVVKHVVGSLQNDVLSLAQKLAEMEDRSQRCNWGDLSGLSWVSRGQSVPSWELLRITSLLGKKIEIQQAHCIYTTQDKATLDTQFPTVLMSRKSESCLRTQSPHISIHTPDLCSSTGISILFVSC